MQNPVLTKAAQSKNRNKVSVGESVEGSLSIGFSQPFSVNCIALWSRSPLGGGWSGSPTGESGNQRRAPTVSLALFILFFKPLFCVVL